MKRALALLVAALLAAPAHAQDKDAQAPQKDAQGQTSDAKGADDTGHVKGYGYGTPSGTESNASAGQPTKSKRSDAPQEETGAEQRERANPSAAGQGENAGPGAATPATPQPPPKRTRAKRGAKRAKDASGVHAGSGATGSKDGTGMKAPGAQPADPPQR